MKWDSIKSRLLLMTILCVLGMGLMTVNQHYFGQRLSHLNAQNVALQQLQQDLLQLRRHEKDFLLRRDRRYLELFREQHQIFMNTVNTLNEVVEQFELPASLISDIAINTERYAQQFYKLAELLVLYGLDADTGISGRLRHLSMQLNGAAEKLNLPLVGQATYLAADYQLTARRDTLDALQQLLSRLLENESVPGDTGEMLVEFRAQLNQLAGIKAQIGINEQQGLRGEFRELAHQAESDLAALNSALQPVLTAHQEQAAVYSMVIALLTSVAVILLLIKSFATFHRSFANFVLFFYRCKRQYQRIYPKQLGFSEFRSLAALANEMVESRRQIERRLEKLESANRESHKVAP